MEIYQLRYFVAAAEAGSFTAAAKRNHVSQPSLSQQIKRLEDELGHRLFDRLGRRVELTQAGHTFYERSLRILQEVDDASRAVREAKAKGELKDFNDGNARFERPFDVDPVAPRPAGRGIVAHRHLLGWRPPA